MADVTVGDLQAIGDIADWLAEQADSLDAETSIALLEAAQAAQKKLKVAIELLETQALQTIEQPILIGSVAWSKKPSFKTRPQQSLIAVKVIAAALDVDPKTGEIRGSLEAAEAAVRLMQGLYVSPSTVPKVGGVRALGLEMSDVCRDEHTGFELKRTELE